jgi:hypothetical protein
MSRTYLPSRGLPFQVPTIKDVKTQPLTVNLFSSALWLSSWRNSCYSSWLSTSGKDWTLLPEDFPEWTLRPEDELSSLDHFHDLLLITVKACAFPPVIPNRTRETVSPRVSWCCRMGLDSNSHSCSYQVTENRLSRRRTTVMSSL